MMWYRTGTVTLTNGQQAVVGAGTDWVAAKAAQGDAITLPDGRDYEIQAVNSSTSITLTTAYLGANAAGAAYQIKPIATAARLIELSTQAATLVQQFAEIAQQAGVGKFAAGAVSGGAMRPSVRGLADDDSGWNFAGGNVLEQWQGGVKTASYAADGTPSGPVWDKAPVSAAVAALVAGVPRAIPDGTVAAPGLAFGAQGNTGLRRSAANTMQMVIGGTDAVQIDPTGLTTTNNRSFTATGTGRMQLTSAYGVSYTPANSTGSWARGLVAMGLDGSTVLAGAGFLGSGETITRYAVGFNSGWWTTFSMAMNGLECVYNVPTRWANGSAAAPSVSFVNSNTSGFYLVGGVGIGVSVNGAQRAIFGTATTLIGAGMLSTAQAGVEPAFQVRGASLSAGSLGVTNSAADGRGGILFLGKDRGGAAVTVGDAASEIWHTAHNGASHVNTGIDRMVVTGVVANGAVSVRKEAVVNGVTVETTTSSSKAMSVPLRLASYTLTTLPSAAASADHLIDVSNATGGAKVCRSNGSVWQILNTNTTVS